MNVEGNKAIVERFDSLLQTRTSTSSTSCAAPT